MEWTTIEQVLMEMEETHDTSGQLKSFSIAWVRATPTTAGPRGSIKVLTLACKYTDPTKKVRNPKKLTEGWKFKQHGVLPIQDLIHKRLLTPKITHLIEFNGKKIKHYGDVHE